MRRHRQPGLPWRLGAALVALALVTACGAAGRAADAGGLDSCPTNASTRSLTVAPSQILRDDPVVITVIWYTDLPLTPPLSATLATDATLDNLLVEVDVDLDEVAGDSWEYAYAGTLLNPFGTAVPAGPASVLAAATPRAGCQATPTAATSFLLE